MLAVAETEVNLQQISRSVQSSGIAFTAKEEAESQRCRCSKRVMFNFIVIMVITIITITITLLPGILLVIINNCTQFVTDPDPAGSCNLVLDNNV